MKTYHVITIFPELIEQITSQGVLGQARKNKILQVNAYSPRVHTSDVHKTVDDRPYGGGDGMLLMAEPLQKTLESISSPGKVIYLSPQGKLFDDSKAREYAELNSLTLICGRYSGVDQRFLNRFVDEEISIGNYVLSGGEIAAAAVIDASCRFVPGVLGHGDSAEKDSLSVGYLEGPSYTRPREYLGVEVPEMLLSGHHAQIEKWKYFVGLLTTLHKRPETLKAKLSTQIANDLWEFAKLLSEKEKHVLGLQGLEIAGLPALLKELR